MESFHGGVSSMVEEVEIEPRRPGVESENVPCQMRLSIAVAVESGPFIRILIIRIIG